MFTALVVMVIGPLVLASIIKDRVATLLDDPHAASADRRAEVPLSRYATTSSTFQSSIVLEVSERFRFAGHGVCSAGIGATPAFSAVLARCAGERWISPQYYPRQDRQACTLGAPAAEQDARGVASLGLGLTALETAAPPDCADVRSARQDSPMLFTVLGSAAREFRDVLRAATPTHRRLRDHS